LGGEVGDAFGVVWLKGSGSWGGAGVVAGSFGKLRTGSSAAALKRLRSG
jgi:hypothetical protein